MHTSRTSSRSFRLRQGTEWHLEDLLSNKQLLQSRSTDGYASLVRRRAAQQNCETLESGGTPHGRVMLGNRRVPPAVSHAAGPFIG